MPSSPPEHWSLRKSLAFLAATFAIVLGSLTPAAVAASPALGAPIVLCSGDQLMVAYDEDGRSTPVEHGESASLTCAMALLSGLAAVPAPECGGLTPPVHAPTPNAACHASARAIVGRHSPRPPSTAPPLS